MATEREDPEDSDSVMVWSFLRPNGLNVMMTLASPRNRRSLTGIITIAVARELRATLDEVIREAEEAEDGD